MIAEKTDADDGSLVFWEKAPDLDALVTVIEGIPTAGLSCKDGTDDPKANNECQGDLDTYIKHRAGGRKRFANHLDRRVLGGRKGWMMLGAKCVAVRLLLLCLQLSGRSMRNFEREMDSCACARARSLDLRFRYSGGFFQTFYFKFVWIIRRVLLIGVVL